jgi:integrase
VPRKKTRRRGTGEGAIFESTRTRTRKDGTTYSETRWEGKVSLGFDSEGKRQRRTVYGDTQRDVIEKIAAIRGEIADGTFSQSTLTVKGYLKRWLTEKARQVKPRTTDFYAEVIGRHIVPRIGKIQVTKLTPLMVQTFVGEVADEVSVNTANHCRTTLFTALKQAVRWQVIARNPVDAVEKLKDTKRPMVIWTLPQAASFLSVARDHRLYAAFHLAIATGLRRGEILGLRWHDIRGSTLHVAQSFVPSRGKILISTPKTGRGVRRVALSPGLLEVLGEHRQRIERERERVGDLWPDLDLVFPSEIGTPLHPRNFQRTWDELQAKANARLQERGEQPLPHARIHDLRHLNVSLRRHLGQDPKLVADQIGHVDPAFTLRLYSHLFEHERQAAAVDLKEALGHE